MMIFFYCPGALKKSLATQIVAALALFFKLALNNILGSNAGVVCTGNPQGIIAFHTVIADNDVLQCIVQTVSHMEHARYVRRRNDDRICTGTFSTVTMNRRFFIACRFKITFCFPFRINAFFKIFWIIRFLKFNCFHKLQ